MNRIQTIIDKEWAEVFKNRAVLLTVVLLPVLFTVLPLVVLNTMRGAGVTGGSTDMPANFARICNSSYSASDCMQVYIINEFLLLFMLMPLAIPIAISAYSIVGEKTTHSLEPLLATPISTVELLTGKAIAAAAPAILATWACFAIFALATPLVGASAAIQAYILSPIWLIAIIVLGPLMTVAAVIFSIMVSSRVADPRVAEQVSMVLIVPLLGLLFAQIGGLVVINVEFMLISVVVLALIDVGLMYLGASFFQRENILTKWK